MYTMVVCSKERKLRTFDEFLAYGYRANSTYVGLPDILDVALQEKEVNHTKALMKDNGSWLHFDLVRMRERNGDIVEEKFMEIDFRKLCFNEKERIMLRRLPCYVPGYVPPVPDVSSRVNKLWGLFKRMGRVGPKPVLEPDAKILTQLRSFVRSLLAHNYKAIPNLDDISFETWLEEKAHNYPEARKQELRDLWAQCKDHEKACASKRISKFFLKIEHYTDFKYPRIINAMQDFVKIRLAAATKLMEEAVYANANELPVKFIKHIPIAQRAQYIADLLIRPGFSYVSTDYSSFESSFHPKVMKVVEGQLYKYFLKNFANINADFELLTGKNKGKSDGIRWWIHGTRMSGEMTTSLGNGFTNLVLVLFAAKTQGVKVFGVVEGDDGLFSSSKPLDFSILKALGFDIKEIRSSSPGAAGFCGLYFEEKQQRLFKPILEPLARLGWTLSQGNLHAGPKRMLELLKAKVASALYETPSCPILAPLCYRIWTLLPKVTPKFGTEDAWWEQQVMSGVSDPGSLDARVMEGLDFLKLDRKSLERSKPTRAAFAELTGITIEQQAYYEKLASKAELGALDFLVPLFRVPECDSWRRFHEVCMVNLPKGSPWN